ncbi:MAG TPA: hypothetical protein PLV42_08795 [bacterium]|nr:hypothetical protein [bacterium]
MGPRYAPVSADIPLLSNLSVFQNIALIRQYHQRLTAEDSHRDTTALLERFDMCHLAAKRSFELNDRDLFFVKLLRASQHANAAIVIDRPFAQVENMHNLSPIRKALELLDFSGIEGIILGYEWNRGRYEADGQ